MKEKEWEKLGGVDTEDVLKAKDCDEETEENEKKKKKRMEKYIKKERIINEISSEFETNTPGCNSQPDVSLVKIKN